MSCEIALGKISIKIYKDARERKAEDNDAAARSAGVTTGERIYAKTSGYFIEGFLSRRGSVVTDHPRLTIRILVSRV